MKPYLIVCEITPMQVGDDYDMLPLHCTLVHWFWLDEGISISDLASSIGDIFVRPIELTPGEEQVFTAPTLNGDQPVRVTTVQPGLELTKLHASVCDLLDNLGARYEKPEYIRDGWRPHVTHQDGEIVDRRGYVSDSLYIVTAERPEYGSTRSVISKITLNKP